MRKFVVFLFCFSIFACTTDISEKNVDSAVDTIIENHQVQGNQITEVTTPTLFVLGTIQDAGSPHINCHKSCCESYHDQPDLSRLVVSLGFIDPENQEKYLFEATPDISRQLAILSKYESFSKSDIPNGVFLTHAHIGHYTGLMYFGKEATNADNVPVYTMPKMNVFLSSNGPWDQLVSAQNILLAPLKNETEEKISSNLTVVPFTVPHRDEYSETVGYKIIGPNKTALFIPDIDKWEKWEKDILKEIESVDYALLDATFYDATELPNREISQVPHPLVAESLTLFSALSDSDKDKVYFIHFNHTNPILDGGSGTTEHIEELGFHVAGLNQTFEL